MQKFVVVVLVGFLVGCSSVPKPPQCDGSNLRPINVEQSSPDAGGKKKKEVKGE